MGRGDMNQRQPSNANMSRGRPPPESFILDEDPSESDNGPVAPLPPTLPILDTFVEAFGPNKPDIIKNYKRAMKSYKSANKRYDSGIQAWNQAYSDWKQNQIDKGRKFPDDLIIAQNGNGAKNVPETHRLALIINTLYIQACCWVIVLLCRGIYLSAFVDQQTYDFILFIALTAIVGAFMLDLYWKIEPHKWLPKIELIAYYVWLIIGIVGQLLCILLLLNVRGLQANRPFWFLSLAPFVFPFIILFPWLVISTCLMLFNKYIRVHLALYEHKLGKFEDKIEEQLDKLDEKGIRLRSGREDDPLLSK